MEGATEHIFYYLGFPRLTINKDLQALSLTRPVIVNEQMMGGIHRHTIPGSHFDRSIRPACCEPYNKAKTPLVPARVRDVVKAKLIAGPVLGAVSFLKNLAALQSVEIHPQAESKWLVQVEVPGLAEADFSFAPEFSSLAGRPIFIANFPSYELSIVE